MAKHDASMPRRELGLYPKKPSAFIVSSDGTIAGTKIKYRDDDGKVTDVSCVFEMNLKFDSATQEVSATMVASVEVEHMIVPSKNIHLLPDTPVWNQHTPDWLPTTTREALRELYSAAIPDPNSECPCGDGLLRKDCDYHRDT
jgi:hypothetical protein